METPYVLRKHGVYYAHNNQGYVASPLLAELYTENHAKDQESRHDDVYAVPVTKLFAQAEVVDEYIERLQAISDSLRAHKQLNGR